MYNSVGGADSGGLGSPVRDLHRRIHPAGARILWLTGRFWPLLFLAIVGLYAASWSDGWRPAEDPARYLKQADRLQAGQTRAYPGDPALADPPGFPNLLAGLQTVQRHWLGHAPDGFAGYRGLNALMIVTALAGLAAGYFLIRIRAGHATAVLIVSLMAVSPLWFMHTLWIQPDLMFTVGVFLLLVAWEWFVSPARPVRPVRHYGMTAAMFLVGCFIMLATRSVAWLWIGSAVMAGLVQVIRRMSWRRACRVLIPVGVLLVLGRVAWRWPAMFWTPHPDEALLWARLTRDLDRTLIPEAKANIVTLINESLPEAMFGLDFGFYGFVGAMVVMLSMVWVTRRNLFWALSWWSSLLLWIAFVPTDRYMLPFLPMMLLGYWRMLLAGERWLTTRLRNVHGWRLGGQLALYGVLLLFIAGSLRAGRDIGIQHREIHDLSRYRSGKYQPIAELAAYLETNLPEDAVIGTPELFPHTTLGYWSNRRVLPLYHLDHPNQAGWVVTPLQQKLSGWLPRFHMTPQPGLPLVTAINPRDDGVFGLRPLLTLPDPGPAGPLNGGYEPWPSDKP